MSLSGARMIMRKAVVGGADHRFPHDHLRTAQGHFLTIYPYMECTCHVIYTIYGMYLSRDMRHMCWMSRDIIIYILQG